MFPSKIRISVSAKFLHASDPMLIVKNKADIVDNHNATLVLYNLN